MVTLRNKHASEMQRASRERELPLNEAINLSQTAEMPISFQALLPDTLSKEECMVLYLYYKRGCSHSEIAARMGCSVAASRMRMHRAIVHCREFAKKEKF